MATAEKKAAINQVIEWPGFLTYKKPAYAFLKEKGYRVYGEQIANGTQSGKPYWIGTKANPGGGIDAGVVIFITDENSEKNSDIILTKAELREIAAAAKTSKCKNITLYTNYGLELHSKHEDATTVGFNKIVKVTKPWVMEVGGKIGKVEQRLISSLSQFNTPLDKYIGKLVKFKNPTGHGTGIIHKETFKIRHVQKLWDNSLGFNLVAVTEGHLKEHFKKSKRDYPWESYLTSSANNFGRASSVADLYLVDKDGKKLEKQFTEKEQHIDYRKMESGGQLDMIEMNPSYPNDFRFDIHSPLFKQGGTFKKSNGDIIIKIVPYTYHGWNYPKQTVWVDIKYKSPDPRGLMVWGYGIKDDTVSDFKGFFEKSGPGIELTLAPKRYETHNQEQQRRSEMIRDYVAKSNTMAWGGEIAEEDEVDQENEMANDEPDYENDSFIVSSGGYKYNVSYAGSLIGRVNEMDQALELIKKAGKKNNWFPTIWYVSDHGNAWPIDTDGNEIKMKEGGRVRLKSAIARDRAYQSQEPWEQRYDRKTNPKHPKYMEDGGKVGGTKGKFRADVAAIGENRWSNNGMEYDTAKEAEQWLNDLSGRWFGYDLSRVVPAETPYHQSVDLKTDNVFQNFRSSQYAEDGGRIKSAIMRDRAYQSQQPWEQKYHRSGRPAHPHYMKAGGTINVETLEVGDKVGYLNLRTGNYKYVPITKVLTDKKAYELNEPIHVSGSHYVPNIYEETIENLNKYTKEVNKDGHGDKTLLTIRKKRSFEAGGGLSPVKYKADASGEEVWGKWNLAQRSHFLKDHYAEYKDLSGDDKNEMDRKDFWYLPQKVINLVEVHIRAGRYEEGGNLGENLDIYGYQTKHFDISPKMAESIKLAMDKIDEDKDEESAYYKSMQEHLADFAAQVDMVLEMEKKATVEHQELTKEDFDRLLECMNQAAIYNYKAGDHIDLKESIWPHYHTITTHKPGEENYKAGGKLVPTTPAAVKEAILNFITENDLDVSEEKIKMLTELNISRLMSVGYTGKETIEIFLGYQVVNKVKIDGEWNVTYDSPAGLLGYEIDYILKGIDWLIEAAENKQFELGLKYPDFDWSNIVKKYNIDITAKKIKGKIRTYKNDTDQYEFQIFTGQNVVIGSSCDWIRKRNGVVEKDEHYKQEIITNGQFNEGYWGIVSSSKEVINDIVKMIAAKSNGYVKDMDIYVNRLGGVDARDLNASGQKFEMGGPLDLIEMNPSYPNDFRFDIYSPLFRTGGVIQYKDIQQAEDDASDLLKKYEDIQEECKMRVQVAYTDWQQGKYAAQKEFNEALDKLIQKHFNLTLSSFSVSSQYWQYNGSKKVAEVIIFSPNYYGSGKHEHKPSIILFGGQPSPIRKDILLSGEDTPNAVMKKILRHKQHIVKYTSQDVLKNYKSGGKIDSNYFWKEGTGFGGFNVGDDAKLYVRPENPFKSDANQKREYKIHSVTTENGEISNITIKSNTGLFLSGYKPHGTDMVYHYKDGGNISEYGVAEIIRDQIGGKALYMLGAYNLAKDTKENSFSFRIKGSKKVNYIKITLDEGTDTYTMEFGMIRKPDMRTAMSLTPEQYMDKLYKKVAEIKGLHAEDLNKTIEKETGLYTKLFEHGGRVLQTDEYLTKQMHRADSFEYGTPVRYTDEYGNEYSGEVVLNKEPYLNSTGVTSAPGNIKGISLYKDKNYRGDAYRFVKPHDWFMVKSFYEPTHETGGNLTDVQKVIQPEWEKMKFFIEMGENKIPQGIQLLIQDMIDNKIQSRVIKFTDQAKEKFFKQQVQTAIDGKYLIINPTNKAQNYRVSLGPKSQPLIMFETGGELESQALNNAREALNGDRYGEVVAEAKIYAGDNWDKLTPAEQLGIIDQIKSGWFENMTFESGGAINEWVGSYNKKIKSEDLTRFLEETKTDGHHYWITNYGCGSVQAYNGVITKNDGKKPPFGAQISLSQTLEFFRRSHCNNGDGALNVSDEGLIILPEKQDKYNCYTTGYDGITNKYGNEDNVTLEEAVEFAWYFDDIRKKYPTKEDLEKEIKNTPPGEDNTLVSDNIFGVVVYKRNEKDYEAGGKLSLGKDGLKHALLETVSAGTIASMTGLQKYKDIDEVRSTAIQALNRDGDVAYSLDNLKKLLNDSVAEWQENKGEYEFEKKSAKSKFEDGGEINEPRNDKIEIYFVEDSRGNVKNISKNKADADTFFEKSLKFNGNKKIAYVPKADWNSEKITVSNIKQYEAGLYKKELFANGGKLNQNRISFDAEGVIASMYPIIAKIPLADRKKADGYHDLPKEFESPLVDIFYNEKIPDKGEKYYEKVQNLVNQILLNKNWIGPGALKSIEKIKVKIEAEGPEGDEKTNYVLTNVETFSIINSMFFSSKAKAKEYAHKNGYEVVDQFETGGKLNKSPKINAAIEKARQAMGKTSPRPKSKKQAVK